MANLQQCASGPSLFSNDPSSHHPSANLERLSRHEPDVNLEKFHGQYADTTSRPSVAYLADMQVNSSVEGGADWFDAPRSHGSSSFGYHGQGEESISTRGDEVLAGRTPTPHVDKLIQFLHQFQNLYDLRTNAQTLRLHTRDERNKMKSSTRRLQDITRRLVRGIKVRVDVMADLQALEEVIEEMDAQYINHDMYESDLIPAEWKLKEAEKNLYEDLTGEAFLDPAWLEGDGQSSPKVVPQLSSFGMTMIATESPHQSDRPLDDAMAALKVSELETTLELDRLKNDYDEIVEDANMYSAGGMSVTALTQTFLFDYAQRREALLDKLAVISEDIRALESQSSAGDRPKSPTTDALPIDQFSDRETDVLLRNYPDNGDETLQLQAADYRAREDDLIPVLDCVEFSRANNGTSLLPTSLAALKDDSYAHSISVEQSYNGGITTVSTWLSHYFTRSWWSAVRFAFDHYLDNTFSYIAIKRYVTDLYFREGGLPIAHETYGSDQKSAYTYWYPETSDSTPAGVNTMVRTHGQQTSPQKRRHSSGDYSEKSRLKTHVVHCNRPNTQ